MNSTTGIIVSTRSMTNLELHVALAAILIISLIAVFGNLLVFIAFYIEKRIRTPTNYLIFSLAIADVFIGGFSVVIYAVYIYDHEKWENSMALCITWLSLDYWVYQASVLGVMIITIERFLVIRFPLIDYKWTKKSVRIKLAIISTWLLSFLIWVPTTLEHYKPINKELQENDVCMLPFTNDKAFVLSTGLVSYLLPVFIMCCITGYTFIALKENKKTKLQRFNSNKCKDVQKISTFILLMAVAFSLTVLPYGTLSVIKSISPDVVSDGAWRAAYITGYANSMLNPLCYAFGNRHFNKVFKQILCGYIMRKDNVAARRIKSTDVVFRTSFWSRSETEIYMLTDVSQKVRSKSVRSISHSLL